MPTGQQYATNVPQTFITGQINPTATVMSVNSSSGWPSVFPFTAVLEIGTSLQEPVDVTNISGTTWTIVRAIDSTVGFTHNPNATVTHADIGRDFRESRSHMDASSTPDAVGHSVHGLANGSSVVGTTDLQTISGKTLSAPSFTGTVTMGSGTWSGSGPLTEQTLAFTGQSGAAISTTQFAGTVAAGPPSSGTFSTGAIVYDTTYLGQWLCTAGGTPGTWIPLTRMLLFTNTPTGNSTAFGSIPQQFTHLVIEYNARTSNVGANIDYISMQLNSLSTSSYSWRAHGVRQISLGAPAAFLDGNSGSLTTSMNCGLVWTSKIATAASGRGTIELPYYTDTSFWKEMRFHSTIGDGANDALTASGGGVLDGSTAAINTIGIFTASGNFLTGSTFKLYGMP